MYTRHSRSTRGFMKNTGRRLRKMNSKSSFNA
jgi:hypothetical protein